MVTLCLHCKIETINPKFCSRSCSAIVSNQNFPKRIIRQRSCTKCRELFRPPKGKYAKRLCSQCENSSLKIKQNITIGHFRNKLSVFGKHPSWLHSHIRALNRSWNKDLTILPCKVCGYDKHVELCHRQAISSFEDSILVSVVNSKENVVQLCRNCHWEFDNGLLSL